MFESHDQNNKAHNDLKLFPHQEEAVEKIIATFLAGKSRALVSMACGTGKTLVSMETANRLEANLILVLVPSLGLLNQTFNVWKKHFRGGEFLHLCVCSDNSVDHLDHDPLLLSREELNFGISTSKDQIKKFLTHQHGRGKVIFSTYQSAPIVCKAAKNHTFDIAFFDEAHKTVGNPGKLFAFALFEENVCIKHRLFLTATPRKIKVKTNEHKANCPISMDNELIYGERAFNLSFSEAVEKNIVADCQILLSLVTSNEVIALIKAGKINLNGKRYPIRELTEMISLHNAMEEQKIKKGITFHANIKDAKKFAENLMEKRLGLLTNFNVYHINGSMPAKERKRILTEFENSEKAILTNVRCLTEGIDVPAIDLVAFYSPKKSQVDISQAMGRAMRKTADKTVGNILLPIFCRDGTYQNSSLEEKLVKTDYASCWYVLNAIMEQDEEIFEIVREMQQEVGYLGHDYVKNTNKIKLISSNKNLNELKDSVLIKIISERKNWDYKYGLLKRYVKMYGGTTPPRNYMIDGVNLSWWAATQKSMHKKNMLSKRRLVLLQSLGFNFKQRNILPEEALVLVEQFHQENEHCNITKASKLGNINIGTWLSALRKKYRKGEVQQWIIDRLNAIDFDWDLKKNTYDGNVSVIERYYHDNGDLNFPNDLKINGASIKNIVEELRKKYKKKMLPDALLSRLEKIGFDFDPINTKREKMIKLIEQFHHDNGHFDFGVKCTIDGENIWEYACVLRSKKSKLPQWMVDRLNAIGFDWDPFTTKRERMLELIEQFHQENGHCDIKGNTKLNGVIIGRLADNVRMKHRNGKLPQWMVDRLNAIGFDWDPFTNKKERMLGLIEKFYQENGHCDIKQSEIVDGVNIGSFVNNTRIGYKTGALPRWIINRLNAIAFDWDPINTQREKNIKLVEKFYQENGHCDIKQSEIVDGVNINKLANEYRRKYKKRELQQSMINRLNAIAFDWDPINTQREKNIKLVEQFYRENGHCNFKKNEKIGDVNIGNFVTNTRSKYRKGKLPQWMVDRLNAIGLDLEPQRWPKPNGD